LTVHLDDNSSHDKQPSPAPSDHQDDSDKEPNKGETDEQELGIYKFFLCQSFTSNLAQCRTPSDELALSHVWIFQDQGCYWIQCWLQVPFLQVYCPEVQGKGQKGVCHYQDSKDHANLKSHVIKCFGCDVVDAAFANTQFGGHNGSIFAVFACQGQQPVKVSHCVHTSKESRCALYLYFIVFCHEIIGFILQGGVQKATVLPRLSRIANLTSL